MSLKRKAAAAPTASDNAKKSRAITSFFSSAGPPPAVKFDKARWVEGLTAEQKSLLKLEIDTLHESWLAVLKDELVTPSFLSLKKFLIDERAKHTVYPPDNDIYSWSRYTPLDTVKVVIIGQDPYHNPNQAHGLCFSVRPPVIAPPSLKNMYIALRKDYPDFKPPPRNGGSLTPWAENGVLMLNTCLTVRAHEANSHKEKGWEKLTQRAIDAVCKKRTRGVVFMAWGRPAGLRVTKVDRKKHLVLTSVHPSPLSASKGFFDCGHFKKANEWLKDRYGPHGVINWNLDRAPKSTKPAKPAAEKNPLPQDLKEVRLDTKDPTDADIDMDEEEEAMMAAMAAEAEARQSSQEDAEEEAMMAAMAAEAKAKQSSQEHAEITKGEEEASEPNEEIKTAEVEGNSTNEGVTEESSTVSSADIVGPEQGNQKGEEKKPHEDELLKGRDDSAPEAVVDAETDKKEVSPEQMKSTD